MNLSRHPSDLPSERPIVDLSEGAAHITLRGAFGYRQFEEALTAMVRHPAYRTGMNALWDLRGGGFSRIVNAELKRMIDTARDHDGLRAGARVALLVETDLEFGLARMTEILAGDLASEIRVFRDPDAAAAWVSPPGAQRP